MKIRILVVRMSMKFAQDLGDLLADGYKVERTIELGGSEVWLKGMVNQNCGRAPVQKPIIVIGEEYECKLPSFVSKNADIITARSGDEVWDIAIKLEKVSQLPLASVG